MNHLSIEQIHKKKIMQHYIWLAGDYTIPKISDWTDDVTTEIHYMEIKEDARRAIDRGEHEIYGLPKDLFFEKLINNEMHMYEPDLTPSGEIFQQIFQFAIQNRMSHVTHDGIILNVPAGDVW